MDDHDRAHAHLPCVASRQAYYSHRTPRGHDAEGQRHDRRLHRADAGPGLRDLRAARRLRLHRPRVARPPVPAGGRSGGHPSCAACSVRWRGWRRKRSDGRRDGSFRRRVEAELETRLAEGQDKDRACRPRFGMQPADPLPAPEGRGADLRAGAGRSAPPPGAEPGPRCGAPGEGDRLASRLLRSRRFLPRVQALDGEEPAVLPRSAGIGNPDHLIFLLAGRKRDAPQVADCRAQDRAGDGEWN